MSGCKAVVRFQLETCTGRSYLVNGGALGASMRMPVVGAPQLPDAEGLANWRPSVGEKRTDRKENLLPVGCIADCRATLNEPSAVELRSG